MSPAKKVPLFIRVPKELLERLNDYRSKYSTRNAFVTDLLHLGLEVHDERERRANEPAPHTVSCRQCNRVGCRSDVVDMFVQAGVVERHNDGSLVHVGCGGVLQ